MAYIGLSYYLDGDTLHINADFGFDTYIDPETGEEFFNLTYTFDWNDGQYIYSDSSQYPGVWFTFEAPANVDGTYHLEVSASESWTWATASIEKTIIIATHATGDQSITGTDSDDVAFGGAYGDYIALGAGDDWVESGDGVDFIEAGEGNDFISGGVGADTMIGGSGGDNYYVDDVGDTTFEQEDGGWDAVSTTVSLTGDAALGANIEQVYLLGIDDLNAVGNDLGNTINGNAGANTLSGEDGDDALYGGTGADLLFGGHGSDSYIVFDAGDRVFDPSSDGIDLVESTVSFTLGAGIANLTLLGHDIDGTGNSLANTIIGSYAANTLDGKGGADTMQGGTGNDTYVVNHAGDVATEAANAGTDLVQSSASFTLGSNVENLTLTGGAANGTGNSLANIIVGNAAANKLDGKGDADNMQGGTGNDTYIVNHAGDIVTEAASAGTDLVQSAASFTLGANVENLTLTGGAQNGTGNGSANIIIGNSAANRLNGSSGNDTLTGAAGADAFLFNNALNAATNLDHITDFATEDTIQLENAVFSALTTTGTLAAGAFHSAAGATTAQDLDDRIVYNTTTGALYYDADGNLAGGVAAVQFADLDNNATLTSADFLVV